MAIEKALYTATTTTTGGRTGSTESSDGKMKLALSTPKELGGAGGPGTNPEQLFAAGYSACFIGAIKAVAASRRLRLPADPTIKADVSIGAMVGKAGAYGIAVSMSVSVPGMQRGELEPIVAAAHEICPYSNATRGNVDVTFAIA